MNGNQTTPPFQSGLQVKPAVFDVLETKALVTERHESDRSSSIIMKKAESQHVQWSVANFPTVGDDKVPTPKSPAVNPAQDPLNSGEEENLDAMETLSADPVEPASPCPLCEDKEAKMALQLEAMEAKMGGPILEAVENLDDAIFQMSRQMHLDVVTLATQMAQTILQREVDLDSEVLIQNVERAVKTAGSIQSAVIQCHPDDLTLLESHMPRLKEAASPKLVDLSFEKDADMLRGGCRIRFPEGSVDARLDSQLTHLSEAVRSTLLGPRSPEGDEA
jgi:flagellar biosynthesis/type III secretory pathway protein FliH